MPGHATLQAQIAERYLPTLEYRRLGRVLCEEETHRPLGIAAIKHLLFTGVRTGEIAILRWKYIQGNRLMLPDSKTTRKIVWINAPARVVLAGMPERRTHGLVFASVDGDQPPNSSSFWKGLRRRAALPDAHLNDLRHSFASVAISDGISLATIGKLLGHALSKTTARYAHLADAVIAEAAERVCSGLASAFEGKG